MTRLFPLAGACALAGLIPHAPAAAQTVQDRAPAVTAPATPIAPDAMPDDQRYAVHGQATVVLQATPGFASPYAGANSLTPRQAKETVDVTLYAGVRPWAGGELWVNPEIDQGFGLSNTLGVAGFPSAEAYKVGRSAPYTRLQRLFLRQTIDLGGAREAVAGVANQLAGSRTADRLVLTVGKFGVGDVFDTNSYAHDPRADFLNWSAVDTGSFDYAADAWGYSTGIAAEWYRAAWTLRLGAFNLSKVPNGETLETGFGQYQLDAEVEHRHQLAGRPGAVRVTLFRNRGRFGRFDEALALANRTGDVADTAWCAAAARGRASASTSNRPPPTRSASSPAPASRTGRSSPMTSPTSTGRRRPGCRCAGPVGDGAAIRWGRSSSSTRSAARINAISMPGAWASSSGTAACRTPVPNGSARPITRSPPRGVSS